MHMQIQHANATAPRRLLFLLLLAATLLIGGCANIIRSQVTVFHDWPGEPGERTYAFAKLPGDENNLELHTYQNLVRQQLTRLGFQEAQPAVFKVGMEYSIEVREKRVLEQIAPDPFYGGRIGFYGPGRGMFYDPYWYGPTPVMERIVDVYTRKLRVPISRNTDGKLLYDVTVTSDGAIGSLPSIMPFLVRSAFDGFPGQSGVQRVVELKAE